MLMAKVLVVLQGPRLARDLVTWRDQDPRSVFQYFRLIDGQVEGFFFCLSILHLTTQNPHPWHSSHPQVSCLWLHQRPQPWPKIEKDALTQSRKVL